jgi:TolA-binding protein
MRIEHSHLARRWFFLVAACLFLLSVTARADVIELTTGERLEGNVVAETDESVTLKVSREKFEYTTTIARAKIKSITQDSPEQRAQRELREAYSSLQVYKLDASNSLPLADYTNAMQAYRKFLADYPSSPYTDDVAARLKEWQSEMERVARGEVKFRGQWLSGDAAARAANEVRAAQTLQEGNRLVAQGKFEQAAERFRSVFSLKEGLGVATVEEAHKTLLQTYDKWLLSVQTQQLQAQNDLTFAQTALDQVSRDVGEAQNEVSVAQAAEEQTAAAKAAAASAGERYRYEEYWNGRYWVSRRVYETTPPPPPIRMGSASALAQARNKLTQAQKKQAACQARVNQLQHILNTLTSRLQQVAAARAAAEQEGLQAIDAARTRAVAAPPAPLGQSAPQP